MMTWSIAIMLALAATTGQEFVQNPGFETVAGGKPAQWNLFIQKEPGAEGRVDDQVALDGSRSVMLQNPDTYKTEPFNNWSQNILQACRSKRLVVGGHIKTESVGGAALWLQCWQRNPLQVVYVASTTESTPVSGTVDWTPVVLELTVPDTTDFLVVRCVIKGSGKAWFDSITVQDAESFAASPKTDSENKPDAPSAPDAGAAAQPASSPPETANAGAVDAQTAQNALKEIQTLGQTVRELRASNAALSRELAEIRSELAQLRQQMLYSGGGMSLSPQSLSQHLQSGELAPEYLLPRTSVPQTPALPKLPRQLPLRPQSGTTGVTPIPTKP